MHCVTCDGYWEIWEETCIEGRGVVTSEANGCLRAEELLRKDMMIFSVHPVEGGGSLMTHYCTWPRIIMDMHDPQNHSICMIGDCWYSAVTSLGTGDHGRQWLWLISGDYLIQQQSEEHQTGNWEGSYPLLTGKRENVKQEMNHLNLNILVKISMKMELECCWIDTKANVFLILGSI